MKDKLNKVPESLKANEAELAEREALHQQLCNLRPVWQDHVRLEEQEIPSAKKRLEGLTEKKNALDAEIEQVQYHCLQAHVFIFTNYFSCKKRSMNNKNLSSI